MASEPGYQTIAIHKLWNISRSKDNQTMEYNMGNISVEKLYTKCGPETIPRLFSKKSKLSLSLDR